MVKLIGELLALWGLAGFAIVGTATAVLIAAVGLKEDPWPEIEVLLENNFEWLRNAAIVALGCLAVYGVGISMVKLS